MDIQKIYSESFSDKYKGAVFIEFPLQYEDTIQRVVVLSPHYIKGADREAVTRLLTGNDFYYMAEKELDAYAKVEAKHAYYLEQLRSMPWWKKLWKRMRNESQI